MRQRVAKTNTVLQPQFSLYDENESYTFPVIVKAPDSCGKRGISIAHNADEMAVAVAYAREFSSDGRVLVEEYIRGGKEYSVECLAGNGLHEVIQITEKDTSGPPHFTETGHHQPAQMDVNMRNMLIKAAKDIMKALGINCGLAHLEVKIVDGKIYFIEIGARGGGDHIADTLTVRSTDFDYFKSAIDCCLGIYKHKDAHNVAYSGIYFHCKENSFLKPLFDKSRTSDWCISYTVKDESFHDASTNVETSQSGYIIYCSDHKITLKDC